GTVAAVGQEPVAASSRPGAESTTVESGAATSAQETPVAVLPDDEGEEVQGSGADTEAQGEEGTPEEEALAEETAGEEGGVEEGGEEETEEALALDTEEADEADGSETPGDPTSNEASGEPERSPEVAEWLRIEVPANIEQMSMGARQIEAQDLRIYARSLHGNGLHRRAETTWRQALEYLPEHPSAIDGLARSIARQGRLDEALAWAQRAIEVSPENPRHYELVGELLEEQERFPEAVAAYERGLELAPRDSRLRHRLARARRSL
ncbi:MAG: tetratricopeptide repeat protein, partial [Myxococcota bacterium]